MPPISQLLAPDSAPADPRARIGAARPDLQADSPAFRAAVVLLAGPRHAFNIDRIARRYGLPRPWVAACVRRLVDNGVWAGGTAACAWRHPDDPRFWNDAAVAEGRLQRREVDGRVEWAPPGQWEKAYDFVGPQGEPGGPVLYLDAAPRDPPEPAPGPEPAFAAPAPPPPATMTTSPPRWLGAGDEGMHGWLPARVAVAAGGAPELFPEADWLR